MAPIPHAAAELLPRLSGYTSELASHLSKRVHSISRAAPELLRRQSNGGTAVIPSVYKVDGPQPGAVAGIVLGSVAGFILIVMLLFFLSGNTPSWTITGEAQEIAVVRRDDRSSGRRRSRRSSRSERIEVRERSPRIRTTIVEETRRSDRNRAPSIVSERIVESRRGSRGPPPIRRVDGDDVVEVIEEGSSIGDMPPRRDRRRRSSGYRSVDPNRFAGGDYPQVRVDRSGSSRLS